jgi:hypothetical protein
MSDKYYYPKKRSNKRIEYIEILFDNDEYISFRKDELIEYEIKTYDKLVRVAGKVHPYAESGYLKFKIKKYPPYHCEFIFDRKNYKNNRINFIVDRCINYGGIIGINFIDDYNWSYKIYGNFEAIFEDDMLNLIIKPKPVYESSNSDFYYITLPKVKKNLVQSIDLIFENCENVEILRDDILDINLVIRDKLTEFNYERLIIGGYIKIKINSEYKYRHGSLHNIESSSIDYKRVIKRILELEEHWICRLDVTYNASGYCFKESFDIKDIRFDYIDEVEDTDIDDNDDYEDIEPYFVGGHVTKSNDEVITITFK